VYLVSVDLLYAPSGFLGPHRFEVLGEDSSTSFAASASTEEPKNVSQSCRVKLLSKIANEDGRVSVLPHYTAADLCEAIGPVVMVIAVTLGNLDTEQFSNPRAHCLEHTGLRTGALPLLQDVQDHSAEIFAIKFFNGRARLREALEPMPLMLKFGV
jgi:hypothetical protein